MKLIPLNPIEFTGFEIEYAYETQNYYKVVQSDEHFFALTLELSSFEEPVKKHFTSKLYEPFWENPQAFALEGSNGIVGYIQVCDESWHQRMRVTDLLVLPQHRKMGFGKTMLEALKLKAIQAGFRELVLETQTCNTPAIALYHSCGFRPIGVDLTAYGDDDVAKNEVRLELSCTLKRPLARLQMASGAQIQIEITPTSAPNAATSFIWLANQGAYNNRAIQRIVPDFVIQPSYNSFDKDPVCDFLIDNESRVNGHENSKAIALTKYAVAMGGDGETLASGSCFYIVVGDAPRLDGKYPGFGRIISGFEELERLVALPLVQVPSDVAGVVINAPLEPEVIANISVETYGIQYGEPVKTEGVLAYER